MNLSESEGKYKDLPRVTAEELYEDAPCGYLSFVGDGTIVMINKTLLTWLGFERSEILYTKKFQHLLSIGGRIFFETHFFPLVRMQGFVKEINFDLVRQDKSSLPVLLNVNEVTGSQDNQTVFRATIFDITDRKKYERELLDARKKAEAAAHTKSEFLATVSHEIRTPLNAITGIANLIQGTPLNDQQKEYVRILKLSADGLLALVNDVLDLSKIEKGGVKLEERIFSIKDVALTVVHTLRVKAVEKGIQLKINLDENLPEYCIGDPLKLTQILTNLVGNAVKFTPAGSVELDVNIVTRKADNLFLNFKIADTGIGIPQERLQAIFEEFTQANYDVNLNYGGTGLGLTISQKLLQLHGSSISVKSEVGAGSEFSFLLNYRISSVAPTVEVPDLAGVQQNTLHSARVLVVDDTPLNLTIVLEFMKSWGIHCDAANSGAQALELVQTNNYHVVLMDLHMPDMNGYKATEEIRKANLSKQPAIIALSASATGYSSEKLKLAGFDGCLAKPFSPNDLFQTLLKSIDTCKQESIIKHEAFSKEENKREIEEQVVLGEKQSFDLSYYTELTDVSGGSFHEVIKITISSFETFRDQFISAVEKKDRGVFAELIHKSKMPIYYIQAHDLETAIMEVRDLMEQDSSDANLLNDKLGELKSNFNRVIEGLKSIKLA